MDPLVRHPLLVIGCLSAASALLILLHQVYFHVLPQRAMQKYRETNPERLTRYLKRVAATPSLLGSVYKLVAHQGLVDLYLSGGQHALAADYCRASIRILSHLRMPGPHKALEADLRRRLADCLEALGESDEAEEERNLAAAAIDRATAEPLRHLTEGTLHERQNRHEEAYAAFERALEVTPPSNKQVRIECMTHLVLSAFNSGRPADCLRWAGDAIALGANGKFLLATHRMAGVACGNLGRLDESEQHFRQAYDAAIAENNTPAAAEILASLADCLRKRGELVDALEICDKSAAMHPKASRMALGIKSMVLRDLGRYDEALAALEQFKQTSPLAIPYYERRLLAVLALDTARIEADCRRGGDAWQHIEEALAVLGDDAKLGLSCEAAACWALAVRGGVNESQRRAEQLEPRLADFDRDPSTCRTVFY
ncbi:MAG TPA: tetratricopeptide repeat protein, partial [Pirellulales bacterium]